MRPSRTDLLRRIVLAACALALALAASLLLSAIQVQRENYELNPFTEEGNVPPGVEFATKCLGPLRPIFIINLWMRASNLQEEGKFFELNDLCRLITQLEPRFPAIWAYWAWNVAYNCSVKFPASQPQERWRWVKMGIEILRDDALRINPRAAGLYRELSWLYSHKIGQDMDDAHLFYKGWHALEMQEALGRPPYLERLEAIAAAPRSERELRRDTPVAALLDALKAAGVEATKQPLAVANRSSDLPQAALDILNIPANAEAFARLEAFLRAAVLRDRLKLEPGDVQLSLGDVLDWSRFCAKLRDQGVAGRPSPGNRAWQLLPPNVRAAIEQAAEGKTLPHDVKGGILAALNDVLKMPDLCRQEDLRRAEIPPEAAVLLKRDRASLSPHETQKLNRFVFGAAFREELGKPGIMLRLMRRLGPIDWRLPEAHSLYWTERSLDLAERDSFNELNAARERFWSAFRCCQRGRLRLVPGSDKEPPIWEAAPNYTMVDALIQLHQEDMARFLSAETQDPAREAFFNFLRNAILDFFILNDAKNASRLLAQLIELGGEPPMGLSDFTTRRFNDLLRGMTTEQAIINVHNLFVRMFEWESLGDMDSAATCENYARLFYTKYKEGHDAPRLRLPPIENLWKRALLSAILHFRKFQVDELRRLHPAPVKDIEDELKRLRESAPPEGAKPAPPPRP
jgi:hypothetical protein